ncbi:carbohydrate ABC transporter permease [Bacillus sp. JJ722]|uniref:carbohydrate ABC transporter permease n=1 Tax=Bacillus sp. JJ722 TaxID=3122973 RepID=UPI002FFD9E08
MRNSAKFFAYKSKTKKVLFGLNGSDGIVLRLGIYALLIGIGFVYLNPIISMISYSFKSLDDLLNPLVNYIPTALHTENYEKASEVLNFFPTLLQTLAVTVIPSIIQTCSAAMVGYGFARFNFPFKKVLFVFVLITFIIPPQVLAIPRYVFFYDLNILGSIHSYSLLALFVQGFNSAIFVLIFYQFFKSIPKALEEAAQLDGAGHFKIFFKIAVPMAVPAFIISFLFSFVWYWNETFTAALYFGDALTTLPLQLERFAATFEKMFASNASGSGSSINEAIKMAGTMLSILPLLIVYFITQRWFVEGVDRSGITGE